MRKRTVLFGCFIVVLLGLVYAATFSSSVRIPYHEWQMEAAYESLFGNPEPVGDGLARFEVTATDVDAALESYQLHRTALVDLGALVHMQRKFPRLASDGSKTASKERSEFVRRMWDQFPGHRHYWLAPNGTFETWASASTVRSWSEFLDRESI